MKITIIGSGYVGLVTGACLSEVGISVSCVDIDKAKIQNLKKGIIPIYEPGLENIIKKNYEKNRLSFTTDLNECVKQSQAIFIAVGTPPGDDGSADLSYVLEVARNIGKLIDDYTLVITKSTVPVGTAKLVKNEILGQLKIRKKTIEFDVASNPEFLKEGDAIRDFMRPERIVIGVESERAKDVIDRIYRSFILNGHQIIYMDITSAELTKYAANSMLATRISFMNELSELSLEVGADINLIRKGIGSDSRIGSKFLYPGIGYGGSCFPKDVKALIKTADENGINFQILKSVEERNKLQKEIIFKKLRSYFDNSLRDKKICIWGLSFKPNTDDMREAPSITLINSLLNSGADVHVCDPIANTEASHIFGEKITYYDDYIECSKNSDAIVLVTEWGEFRNPEWKKINSHNKNLVVFDGRNIYEKKYLEKLGIKYFGIGY